MTFETLILRTGKADDPEGSGNDWLSLGAQVDDASAEVQPSIDADTGSRSVTVQIPRTPMTQLLAQGNRQGVTHFYFRSEYWRLLAAEHAEIGSRNMRLIGQALVR